MARKDEIELDMQHGVNPSIETCWLCGEDKGLILWGKLKPKQLKALHDAGFYSDDFGKAPYKVCLSQEPCEKCKKYMEEGVILISVDEKKSTDKQNPYRTGGWVVIKDEAIEKMVHPKELAEQILQKRVAFVPDEAWDLLGIPRGEVPSIPGSTETTVEESSTCE